MNARLAPCGALEQKLQSEQRFSGPGPTLNDGGAGARQSAPEHRVETGDPCLRTFQAGNLELSRAFFGGARLGASHARKEGETAGADFVEVAARDVVCATELQHLHFAHR